MHDLNTTRDQIKIAMQSARLTARDVCNRLFLFLFSFCSVFEKKTRIWFGMSLVRFGLKNAVQFGYYVFYLCNSLYNFDVTDFTHNNDNKEIMKLHSRIYTLNSALVVF